MSDIVERLRATPNWQRQDFAKWKDAVSVYDRAPFEAADEIDRLRAALDGVEPFVAALRAERDALQSKIDFHRARTAEAVAENKDAKAQLAALRELLREELNSANARAFGGEVASGRLGDELDALREAAGKVTCWECNGTGLIDDASCPDCADLRALLQEPKP
jgi:chromosome segregation ATPase